MELFVIVTVQKPTGAGSFATGTTTRIVTLGPELNRAGLYEYVMKNVVPEQLRKGNVLFFSAEPLSFVQAGGAR